MYFSLIIVVLALAAQQTIADSQSPFAQQPQHYTVVQTDSKYPSDVKSIYSVQQQPANEIDSSKSTQLKVNTKIQFIHIVPSTPPESIELNNHS